ncbi:MAG: hypothetical protein SOR40_08825 [Rothia sp. (in: high G+C Gram-positive bacteria)]|nr:hypothetical protein [Rothia sp. (in: high G+C Gram-positive bacteria)]
MPQEKSNWYFVCTGNICRSALAQAYLAHLLPQTTQVSSGGTGINPALGPTSEIQAMAAQLGTNLAHHRPKPIAQADLLEQDVILTATREHRLKVLAEAPSLLNRTFTIKEFAYLLENFSPPAHRGQSPSSWWRNLAQLASGRRRQLEDLGGKLDIADPYKQDVGVYQTCTREISEALQVIADFERARILSTTS